jgi:hypothetical protein
MNKAWMQYQQQSATFFLKMGLTAKTEQKVRGARSQFKSVPNDNLSRTFEGCWA